jgi:hypothetical protein
MSKVNAYFLPDVPPPPPTKVVLELSYTQAIELKAVLGGESSKGTYRIYEALADLLSPPS